MRTKLLLGLMAAALPFLCTAKDNPAAPPVSNQLHFLENKGQVIDQFYHPRTDIDFSIGTNGMKAFIGNGQIHYQFSHVTNQQSLRQSLLMTSKNAGLKLEHPQVNMYRMDVELLNANTNAVAITEQKQEAITRFYQQSFTEKNSKGKIDKEMVAASYDKITYKNVYPHIDWVIYVKDNQLEYEFVVNPGGNPADIQLKYKGASSVKINEDGSLVATTPMGNVNEKAPYSFQADGRKVNSSFKLNGDVLSFNVDNYTGTLVIDPTLTWGTYFGDAGDEEFKSVVYDGTGNIYIAGYTSSTTNMATLGAYQTANNGFYDAIVAKITTGGALVWSTFYGTTGDEIAWSLNFNGTDLIMAGTTDYLVDNDALLVKFSSTGAYSYGFAVGGLGDEIAYNVDRSSGNDIYLACRTTTTNNVNTVGQTVFGGGTYDGLLMKCDNAGTFIWGTYLGGSGEDAMLSADVDNSGNICVAGWTSSTAGIATSGVSQQFIGGSFDGFVAKYNSSGIKTWGTYWGGTGDENLLASELDGSGNIYVTGLATSTGLATNGAYQTTMNGQEDVLIGKYSGTGTIQWGTYYGGTGYDEGYGITLDPAGNVFVAGYTESSASIATLGSYDEVFGGVSDAFLCKFTGTGGISWGTYYGGSGLDWLNGVCTDNASYVYVAGYTESTGSISLNTTIQSTYASSGDCVAAKFLDCLSPLQPSNISGSASVCAGSTQTYSVVAVSGVTYAWTLPNGWTGTSSTNSITVTVGTTGGTLSVTANNSCGMSAPQNLTITVNPVPTATVTPAGPTTFCQGGSVLLNANTGTGYTYQWYQGPPIPGATNSSYLATGTGNYTVQITANGCSATSSAVTVTVNPNPATPTASSNSPVCVGDPINFTGTTTTTGVTYNWTGPNNFPNTQNPTIATAQGTDAGTYTLTVVDGNGCSATATTTVVVTTGAPATPSAITGPNPICEGTTNTYSVTNDVNASQYNWSLPTGWSGTSSTNSISATADATSGVISVTAQNGCGVSAPSTLNVTVNPLPVPTIIQAGGFLTTTSTYTTYQWYNGTTLIPGATQQSYTPTANGTYHVVVTDANGCSGTSNNLTFSLGVNGLNTAGNLGLYPNPNTGSFTIEGSFVANDGKVNVEIVDIAGRIVHKQQVSISKNVISARIDMNTSLAPGIYTIKLISDAQNSVVPFVKK